MEEVKKQGMESFFVPYEIALTLKELGFDEECFGFYDAYNGSSHLLLNDRYEPLWLIRTWQRLFSKKYQDTTFVSQSYVEYINGVCLAPTFSQAFRWFREKYNLYISLNKYKSPDMSIPILVYTHIYNENNNICITVGEFKTYEEAELECLKKLIEICRELK